MVNYNGNIISETEISIAYNRSFLYGDGIFETVKIVNGKILFFEDHYFRLMAAMRIMRMEIPMTFTMEYLEQQILETARVSQSDAAARARLTVYREQGGLYLPQSKEVSFVITAESIQIAKYVNNTNTYEVDLYKDFFVPTHLLSTLKTTSKQINITGSIYAAENGLQSCLLLNEHKNIVEALSGNLFMVTGNQIVTPPLSDGCLNGIMRKQIISLLEKDTEYLFNVHSISPFDLQKADELFVTNVVSGVQSVSKYRKKEFQSTVALKLVNKLNEQLDLLI